MDYGTLADSECSSGCESGWTLYLENSYIAPYHSCQENKFLERKSGYGNEEEEEDLSMVSDASSGPPLFLEEDDDGNDNNNNNGCSYHVPPVNSANALPKSNVKRQKNRENQRRNDMEQHPSALDDTASSPIFNLNNNNFTIKNQASVENVVLDFSQGYSTTHFQEQYGFFLPSLHSENQLLVQNQWFEGKKWG